MKATLALIPLLFGPTTACAQSAGAETVEFAIPTDVGRLVERARDLRNWDLPLLHYVRRPMRHEESIHDGISRIEFWVDPAPGEAPAKRVFRLYRSDNHRGPRRPLVLVFPFSGDGDWRVCKQLCAYFRGEGMNCAYFEKNLHGARRSSFEQIFRLPQFPPASVEAARRGLDVLEETGVIAPGEKIGVIGISLGSFEAALTAITDSRVGAAAIVAGGGGIAKILAQTAGAGVDGYVRARDEYMREKGMTPAQLIKQLEGASRRSEPLAYIQAIPGDQRLSPERYLLINAEGDMAVPNESSEALYQALRYDGRQPDRENISHFWLQNKYMHVALIFDLPYIQKRAFDHFYRYLAPRLDRPARVAAERQ